MLAISVFSIKLARLIQFSVFSLESKLSVSVFAHLGFTFGVLVHLLLFELVDFPLGRGFSEFPLRDVKTRGVMQ